MHPAKPRRTDRAASTLTKPFRSPRFVKPDKCNSVPSGAQNQQKLPASPSVVENKSTRLDRIAPLSPLPPVKPPSLSIEPDGSLETASQSHSEQSPHVSNVYVSEHAVLSKQRRALALQLRTISAAVDTTSQALSITRSKQIDDLETSIVRWRNIAQNVAEYLFLAVKDHVNDSGGLAACRQMESTSPEPLNWLEAVETDANRLSNEQKEQLKAAHEEARMEAEKYGLCEPRNLPVDMCDKSMTMEMMLRQLGIDADVVGYDVQSEQWVD